MESYRYLANALAAKKKECVSPEDTDTSYMATISDLRTGICLICTRWEADGKLILKPFQWLS